MFNRCRSCGHSVNKERILQYDALCKACSRLQKRQKTLVVNLVSSSNDVRSEDILPSSDTGGLVSSDTGGLVNNDAGIMLNNDRRVVSLHGRDVSDHLLHSSRWIDFTSRLDKKYHNLDRLEMEGRLTDTTVAESNSATGGSESEEWDDSTYDDESLGEPMGYSSPSDDDLNLELDDLRFVDNKSGDGGTHDHCSVLEEDETVVIGFVRCHNCRREGLAALPEDPVEWCVILRRVATTELCFRHRWKSFTRKDLHKRDTHVTLCSLCVKVLKKRDASEKSTRRFAMRDVWPVYMWLLLSHAEMQLEYGSDAIHLMPRQWWKYWKRSLLLDMPLVYSRECWDDYESSVAVVLDVTCDRRAFKNILMQKRLGELKRGCNDYLSASVLCPWGCAGFIHDAGRVSFDAVLCRFFPFLDFAGSISTKSQKEKVASSRCDFFSFFVSAHLFNPKWTVNVSVFFDPHTGPVFLTCDDHSGGTKDKYFHLPKTGNCLPSRIGDQLSFVVLRARTLHKAMARKYSNTYQMNLFLGNYSGVDCTWVSELLRFFDFHSHLSDLTESRSFRGREDIRGLVSRLVESGTISSDFAQTLEERSRELFPDHNKLDELCLGATMMTLLDVMYLQRCIAESQMFEVKIGGVGSNNSESILKLWPSYLVRVHPCDGYGATVNAINPMRSGTSNNRLLWFLSQLLLCVNVLWEHTSHGIKCTEQWHGYVLTYLSRVVLKQSRTCRCEKNPFRFYQGSDMFKPEGLMRCLLRYIDNSDSAYRVGDFEKLFHKEKDDGVIRFYKFRFMSVLGIIEDECDILWFSNFREKEPLKPPRRHDIADLPLELQSGDSVFELRFIGTSFCNKFMPHEWDGTVWMRYGTSMFPKWWVMDRRGKKARPARRKNLDAVAWGDIDMALYIRKRRMDLEQYRREYLKHIGGQSVAGCACHDIPLIISPRSSEGTLTCYRKVTCPDLDSVVCGKVEEYRCPVDDCTSRICKSCYSSLPADTMTMINVETPLLSVESQTEDSSNADLQDSSDDEVQRTDAEGDLSDTGCLDPPPSPTMLYSGSSDGSYGGIFSDEEIDDESGVISVSICAESEDLEDSMCSEVSNDEDDGMEGFDASLLCTGFDCVGPGTGDCDPTDEDELGDVPLMGTTHSAGDIMGMSGDMKGMGSSVLLNKCGSMLIRRQSRLQASRRERNFMERVVSRKDLGTVPLVYLEGVLFPSIFWRLPHSSDGGILGSIPTPLFCQHDTRKQYGIASMADHAKMRLKSVGNSASTSPDFLAFTFDTLANGAVEGHDTRIVLSRGFESCMGPAGMRLRDQDDDLYSDGIDNRQNVHNLCAAERIRSSDLFVTLTCNQARHFGIKKIKNYVDSGEALENYKKYLRTEFPTHKELSTRASKEVQFALNEASRTLIVRHWLEVKKFLLEYLLKSPEMPLTEVLKLFSRDEYQTEVGNLSHMHMLVTLVKDYSSPEGRKAIQKLVRGFVDDIVCDDEVEQLIEEGILDDYNDYHDMKDDARSFLPHTHSSRCMRRTGTGKDDLKCRVPDTRCISGDLSQFHEAVLPAVHSKESLVIMSRLGLITVSEDNEVVPHRDYLKSRRIHAPARFGEGNITPVVGRLFAATRSTMNVQICTSHGTTRYVVKYVIKIDETNYVVFSCKKGEEGLKAEKVFLHNTKITSSAINEKKRLDASRDSNKPRGRAVAVTEMEQIILGKPQVFCSMEFIKVPSLPLGERPGCERKPPEDKFNDLVNDGKVRGDKDSFNFMVPIVKFRIDHCSPFRQHTDSQVMMLEDQMVSRVTLDKVFIFGVRPPELLPFDKMEWYFRYFERSEECVISKTMPLEELLFRSLEKSVLLDGLGHRLRIRCKAIPLIQTLLQDKDIRQQFPQHARTGMLCILDKICHYYTSVGITIGQKEVSTMLNMSSDREWKHLQLMYVSYYCPKKELPIVVFSNVKPRNACKFAIHVLLSMGHFCTERDLWISSSVRKAFVIAKLVPDRNGPSTDDDVDALLKYWIEDQLRTYPVGSTMMDQYIVTADEILRSILIHGILPLNEIPPVMYTSLVQDTNDKITDFLKECKIDVVDATLKALMEAYSEHDNVLPLKQKLLQATKQAPLSAVDWNPIGPQTSSQSNESYTEQTSLNRELQSRIDQYRSPSNGMPKNMLIAGPPGVGKTHCLSHSVCYTLSQGLFPMTTALLAERAFLLGGKHLHLLFKLTVRDRGTPHRLAELAVITLQKKIELFALLRHIDVLFIDECGQISAELLSVLDIILRKVRDSDLFMGGILIIGTIDQVQLRPIKGLPFLLSPYVLTTFCMTVLKQYVRCADCLVLQQLNELARNMSGLGEAARRERLNSIRDLMNTHCTFVNDWTDPVITDDVLRVFPRKEETAAAVTTFLTHKKEQARIAGRPYICVKAVDSMIGMQSHGDWLPANRSVVSLLTKQCREPQHLDLYEGAIYQFTFNCPGRFKSTQLGVLLQVPSQDILVKHGEFEIFVAPAGTRTFRIPEMTEHCLVSMGFTKTKVGTAPDRSHNLWRHGMKAKRRQYALKHHIASTIHSAIGHTVLKLATELGAENNLWERAMVVVLISRVKKASDLIFVGDKKANIDALIEGLQARNQYDDYMENIVRVLSGESGHMEPLSLNLHPFRYKDIALPQDRSGLVYMLVSLRDTSSMYLGQTTNMLLRLKCHNSGFGAHGSATKEKRPWGLYAYICGFAGDKSLREEVEAKWQNTVDFLKPKGPRLALQIGQRILKRYYSESKFKVVVADEV